MRINELEIKGNTRLMIRGTNFINIKFNELHQLILGTNGCGKSTIIQELSPMPPVGSDYIKDGYRKINICDSNGVNYTLTSTFSVAAGKHSFINDFTGEELNEGGTQSVQRKLIKEVFKYDQSLHDVLTDQSKFTNMSPLMRRDWLTRISGTNLDYAINLFNKLKRLQRDEDAVVKHLTNRLNKESDNLPTAEDLTALQDRFDNLDKQIKEFYKHRVTTDELPPFRMFEIVQHTVTDSIKLAQEILRADYHLINTDIKTIDDLHERRYTINGQIIADKKRIEELYIEHTDISTLLSDTQGITDEEQLQKLKDRLVECNDIVTFHKKQTTMIHECENAIEVNGRAIGISDQLLHIATEFIDNTESYFTKSERVKVESEIDRVNGRLTKLNNQLKQLEHNIDHITRTDTTICPQCNHTFKAGISETDLPVFEEAVININGRIHELQQTKDALVSYIDEYVKYRNNYINYMNVLNFNADLDFITKFIKPIDLLKDSPNLITTTLTACLRDLDNLAAVQRMMPEIFKLEAAIDKVNSVRTNGNYTQERLLKIENAITVIKDRLMCNNSDMKTLNEQNEIYINVSKMYDELTKKLDFLNDAITDTYTSNKKDVIERMITKVNTDLAFVNMELNNTRNKQNIVDDVARQRDLTLKKSNNLKLLVDEINPTTGLIADYFKQFIEQFVEQMNIIINKVWEHNIELLPCDVNSEGITYKFPLRVNDKPYGPSDGAKGSNSQVSMINFAFKIVVMVYLGLDDYPLYLDELAPDLDEKHRINIMTFVRDFVESKRCSQLFMVSHYASGYGAFSNAEILILDEENLLNVPNVFNNHCTILKDDKVT